jgi:peptidoglycan/xylan/chitin deacetylase (PgdA/CDA1 family)
MFPHGLMFHHFHGGPHPPVQGSISADDLERIFDAYGPNRILPADEWLDRTKMKTLCPEHVCLTFDDSLKCQHDIAYPVLKERGISGFWFLYSSVLVGELNRLEIYRVYRTTCFDTVEAFYDAFHLYVSNSRYAQQIEERLSEFDPQSYLNAHPFYTSGDRKFRFVRDEILGPGAYESIMDGMILSQGLELSHLAKGIWMNVSDVQNLYDEGHIIGLHSHSHPTKLERLEYEDQFREYWTNIECLENILGKKPTTMSHPSNSYNGDTLEILDRLGVNLGFRADMLSAARSSLEFPRQDHANIMREPGR